MPSTMNTDEKFKKPQQIVGRPQVTKEDISVEFMRNPPNNLELPTEKTDSSRDSKVKERVGKAIIEEKEVSGLNQLLGRSSKLDGLADATQYSVYQS